MPRIRRGTLLVLTSLLVTAPLLVLAVRPERLVELEVLPNSELGITLLTRRMLVEPDQNGTAFFEFRALLPDASLEHAELRVRTSQGAEWFSAQGASVSRGLFVATVQLGSAQYSAVSHPEYAYRLFANRSGASEDQLVSDGAIRVVSRPIAGGEPWFIAALGLLASVLQIATVLTERP